MDSDFLSFFLFLFKQTGSDALLHEINYRHTNIRERKRLTEENRKIEKCVKTAEKKIHPETGGHHTTAL